MFVRNLLVGTKTKAQKEKTDQEEKKKNSKV